MPRTVKEGGELGHKWPEPLILQFFSITSVLEGRGLQDGQLEEQAAGLHTRPLPHYTCRSLSCGPGQSGEESSTHNPGLQTTQGQFSFEISGHHTNS